MIWFLKKSHQNADEIEGKCRLAIVRGGGNMEVASHNAKMTFSDFT